MLSPTCTSPVLLASLKGDRPALVVAQLDWIDKADLDRIASALAGAAHQWAVTGFTIAGSLAVGLAAGPATGMHGSVWNAKRLADFSADQGEAPFRGRLGVTHGRPKPQSPMPRRNCKV